MRLSVPIKLAVAVPVSGSVLRLSKFPGTWLVTLCLLVKHWTVGRTCFCHHSAVCLAWDCTSMMIWIPLPWEASQGQAEPSTWPWKLFSGVLRPLPTSGPENNPQQHLLGLHSVWGLIHGDSNPQRPTGSYGDSWPPWDPANLVHAPTMTTVFCNQFPPELCKIWGQTLLKGEAGARAPSMPLLLRVWQWEPGPVQPRAVPFHWWPWDEALWQHSREA